MILNVIFGKVSKISTFVMLKSPWWLVGMVTLQHTVHMVHRGIEPIRLLDLLTVLYPVLQKNIVVEQKQHA